MLLFKWSKGLLVFPYISTKKNLTNLRTKFAYMNFKFTLTLHVCMLLVLYYWIQLPLAFDNLNFFFGEASWIPKGWSKNKEFPKTTFRFESNIPNFFLSFIFLRVFNLIFYEIFYSRVLNIHISSFFVKNKISNCFASHFF